MRSPLCSALAPMRNNSFTMAVCSSLTACLGVIVYLLLTVLASACTNFLQHLRAPGLHRRSENSAVQYCDHTLGSAPRPSNKLTTSSQNNRTASSNRDRPYRYSCRLRRRLVRPAPLPNHPYSTFPQDRSSNSFEDTPSGQESHITYLHTVGNQSLPHSIHSTDQRLRIH